MYSEEGKLFNLKTQWKLQGTNISSLSYISTVVAFPNGIDPRGTVLDNSYSRFAISAKHACPMVQYSREI